MANATGMTDEEVRSFLNEFYTEVRSLRYWQKAFFAVKKGSRDRGYYLSQSQVCETKVDELIKRVEDRINQRKQ